MYENVPIMVKMTGHCCAKSIHIKFNKLTFNHSLNHGTIGSSQQDLNFLFFNTLFVFCFIGPRWASWNLGIFLCIRCAGIHRNLGVHISKVKSVNLDSWTAEQIAVGIH